MSPLARSLFLTGLTLLLAPIAACQPQTTASPTPSTSSVSSVAVATSGLPESRSTPAATSTIPPAESAESRTASPNSTRPAPVAQVALPDDLTPVPDQVCQASSFYRVNTIDGAPVQVKSDDGVTKTVANATIVLFQTAAARGNRSQITIPGGFTGWTDDRNLKMLGRVIN